MTEVKTQHDCPGGFTLTGSLLAAVILAMVITAITAPFVASARNEQVGLTVAGASVALSSAYSHGEDYYGCLQTARGGMRQLHAWIGGNPSDRHDRPWWGKIDEVAVFDCVLTLEQIKALYEARLPKVRKLTWDE